MNVSIYLLRHHIVSNVAVCCTLSCGALVTHRWQQAPQCVNDETIKDACIWLQDHTGDMQTVCDDLIVV